MSESSPNISSQRDTTVYTSRVQFTSATLLVVTLVALGAISYLNPTLRGNYYFVGGMTAGAAVFLTAFAIASCLKCRKREEKNGKAGAPFVEELPPGTESFKDQPENQTATSTSNTSSEDKPKVVTEITGPISDVNPKSPPTSHATTVIIPIETIVEPPKKEEEIELPVVSETPVVTTFEEESKKEVEEEKPKLEIPSSTTTTTVITEPSSSLVIIPEAKQEQTDAVNIKYFQKTFTPTLMKALNKLMTAFILADCRVANKNAAGKEQDVSDALGNAQDLIVSLLGKSDLYIKELLMSFGKGRISPKSSLRRMIAAFNSGKTENVKRAIAEYEALLRGHDFRETEQKLVNGTVTLENFAEELGTHFCTPDTFHQTLGIKILKHIFSKGQNNPKVIEAFNELKIRKKLEASLIWGNYRSGPKEDIEKEIQAFIFLAFDEAKISPKDIKEWNDELIPYTLNTQFKRTVQKLLGTLARNINMIGTYLKPTKDKEALFNMLDTTFLASESADYMQREHVQKKVLEWQCAINQNREPNRRVGFIIVHNKDSETYKGRESTISSHCFRANKGTRPAELSEIESTTQKLLDQNFKDYKLIAVPIANSDHPLKQVKDWEGTAKMAAYVLSPLIGFLTPLIKPFFSGYLPACSPEDKKSFEGLVDGVIRLMVNPFYNAVIGDTEFKQHFLKIMETTGKTVASRLETLATKDNITFKNVLDEWVDSLNELAGAFDKVQAK